MITQKQKEIYLYDPTKCPFCRHESGDIEWETKEWEDFGCSLSAKCNVCGKEWDEIYTLTDIEEMACR